MTQPTSDADLYSLVQSQQQQLAALPPDQPASQNLLDRLNVGILVPLSPFATKMIGYAALTYAGHQLSQAAQRIEDAAAGVPELYRYPKMVQARVRLEYVRQQRRARQARLAERGPLMRFQRGATSDSSMSTKWWRNSSA